jgi:hypothetical protein
VDAALLHVETRPASGAPRYAVELSLQGLRSWQTKSFPHIVFYVAGAGQLEVWRVLQPHQDIAPWLTEAGPELTAASRGK